MVNSYNIRNRINNKVFSNKNITETIEYEKWRDVENIYGESINTFQEQSTTKAVVYPYEQYKYKFDNAGTFPSSELIMAISAISDIQQTDIIVYKSKKYTIIGIPPKNLKGVELIKHIFLEQVRDESNYE